MIEGKKSRREEMGGYGRRRIGIGGDLRGKGRYIEEEEVRWEGKGVGRP